MIIICLASFHQPYSTTDGRGDKEGRKACEVHRKEEPMNEFIVHKGVQASHDDIVRGTLGIGIEQLIREIRENRGGKYDALYKKEERDA